MNRKETLILAAAILLGMLVGVGTLALLHRRPPAEAGPPPAPAADAVYYRVVRAADGETILVLEVTVRLPPPAGGPGAAEQVANVPDDEGSTPGRAAAGLMQVDGN
jgi:hypothetical protein